MFSTSALATRSQPFIGWENFMGHAEYAIAPASTTFHLPSNISFEEGATLLLASMTAAVALFQHLRLPSPWKPVPQGQTFPVLIYGGASAVGSYA
jgi:NADPH2:quinone reductase